MCDGRKCFKQEGVKISCWNLLRNKDTSFVVLSIENFHIRFPCMIRPILVWIDPDDSCDAYVNIQTDTISWKNAALTKQDI